MLRLPRSFWPFLWYFIKKQPISFALIFTAPLIQILEVTFIPYSLKIIIDVIADNNGNRNNIFTTTAPALWLFGVSWVTLIFICRIQNWWQGYFIPQFQQNIRLTVMNYLSKHSYKYFSDNLSGNLANKVADLARATNAVRLKICWNIISTLGVICAAMIMILQIAPIFALILIIWVISEVIIGLYFSPKISIATRRNAEDVSGLTGRIVDILNNIISVKLFSNRHFELDNLSNLQDKEKISNKEQILILNNYRLFMDVAALIMLGFLMYFLLNKWQMHEIDTAEFVFIFTLYTGIMGTMWYFNEALPDLFQDIGVINQALSLINKPHEIEDKRDATELKVNQGEIIFQNVTFGYKENENVFTRKNVVIPGGQKLGLVGFSGSGKTTFVNLILRFFDVKAGSILIDGQNISDITQDSLRQNISVIPQDTALFHRSILENIRYSNPKASDEQVIQAAKNADCHEFIQHLPDGYNTLVGERGIKLSGGQRQRIAIARSMLKDSPILVLDEATSALDSVTEKYIQDSMHNLMHNKTTIIIAHRLSTLAKTDRILIFDKGQVIEDGSHKDLINMRGHYWRMWNMQAGGFLPEEDQLADINDNSTE